MEETGEREKERERERERERKKERKGKRKQSEVKGIQTVSFRLIMFTAGGVLAVLLIWGNHSLSPSLFLSLLFLSRSLSLFSPNPRCRL
jgi:hypothetical protein